MAPVDKVTRLVHESQLEQFNALEEFFRALTGTSPENFDFRILQEKARDWRQFAATYNRAMDRLLARLKPLYDAGKKRFTDVAELGGMRVVLGGGSRFYGTQFNAVKRATLYADTVLIPDPVFAWMEGDRDDARFVPLEIIKTVFWLVQLKPLVDSVGETLPIVLFPSFEKSLEARDSVTQQGIEMLVTSYFNARMPHPFGSLPEVMEFARVQPDRFLSEVESAQLFIPPGMTHPVDWRSALSQYRTHTIARRAESQIALADSLSDAELMTVAIIESVAPQFHLFENATTLHAQPIMCFEPHWHYFNVLRGGVHDRLLASDLIQEKTVRLMEAFGRERFDWLGKLDPLNIAQVRGTDENIAFRQRLHEQLDLLSDVELADVDRVAAQVSAALARLLDAHDREAERIATDFAQKHRQTAVAAVASLALVFAPALGAVVAGTAPFGLLGKYLWDKLDERKEQRRLSQSLVGVLASARDGPTC